MLFQIISYFKFLINSIKEHSVHSPFVFGLVTKCFKDKSSKDWYKTIENYGISLLTNNTIIEIEDLGAGSKKLQHDQRTNLPNR